MPGIRFFYPLDIARVGQGNRRRGGDIRRVQINVPKGGTLGGNRRRDAVESNGPARSEGDRPRDIARRVGFGHREDSDVRGRIGVVRLRWGNSGRHSRRRGVDDGVGIVGVGDIERAAGRAASRERSVRVRVRAGGGIRNLLGQRPSYTGGLSDVVDEKSGEGLWFVDGNAGGGRGKCYADAGVEGEVERSGPRGVLHRLRCSNDDEAWIGLWVRQLGCSGKDFRSGGLLVAKHTKNRVIVVGGGDGSVLRTVEWFGCSGLAVGIGRRGGVLADGSPIHLGVVRAIHGGGQSRGLAQNEIHAGRGSNGNGDDIGGVAFATAAR